MKRSIFVAVFMAFAGVAAGLSQEEPEQVFGPFRVGCKTDQMSDERSCEITLNPGPEFFISKNGASAFIAFFDPHTSTVVTTGYIRRLRVDKNPAVSGECISGTGGLCLFKNKKESQAFLSSLAKGENLKIEVGSNIFDFKLDDYRTALTALNEMRKTPPKP